MFESLLVYVCLFVHLCVCMCAEFSMCKYEKETEKILACLLIDPFTYFILAMIEVRVLLKKKKKTQLTNKIIEC